MRSALGQSRAFVASHTSTFRKKLGLIALSLFILSNSFSQDTILTRIESVPDTALEKNLRRNGFYDLPITDANKKRIFVVAGINVVGYGSSLVVLNNTWYKNYRHTSFHTFDDSKEWLQVDKAGHGWTAYNTGRISAGMWRWAGL